MARQTVVGDLTEEQMVRRVQEAEDEQRDGRLVRCDDEAELRELLGTLRRPG